MTRCWFAQFFRWTRRRAVSAGLAWAALLLGIPTTLMAQSVSFTEYPIPTANSVSVGITAGPDGAMWFGETSANKIGRITTAG